VSKKQHKKQLARARAKRQSSKYDRRTARNKVIIIVMAILMALSLVAASLVALVGNGEPEADTDEDPFADEPAEPVEGPCPSAEDQDVPEPTDAQYDDPPRFDVDDDVTYVATVHTTCGDIELVLDTDGAPRTAENFLALAEDDFYDGTPFHRTIEGFMIQGGDPTGTGAGGPGYQLDDELDTAEGFEPFELREEEREGLTDEQLAQIEDFVTYPRGTLAMANSGPDTQGSQFFIVHDDSPLQPLYTVIGEVSDGMDVVDDIAAGPVGGQMGDQALDPVIVTGVTVEQR
jgi:peptidyl-prolyl cis-trans isomerase B (cyclophilin B)